MHVKKKFWFYVANKLLVGREQFTYSTIKTPGPKLRNCFHNFKLKFSWTIIARAMNHKLVWFYFRLAISKGSFDLRKSDNRIRNKLINNCPLHKSSLVWKSPNPKFLRIVCGISPIQTRAKWNQSKILVFSISRLFPFFGSKEHLH